jgi:hypothetical protein
MRSLRDCRLRTRESPRTARSTRSVVSALRTSNRATPSHAGPITSVDDVLGSGDHDREDRFVPATISHPEAPSLRMVSAFRW